MRSTDTVLLITLATLALTSAPQAAQALDADAGPRLATPPCATAEIALDEQLAVQKQVDDWIARNGAPLVAGGNIKIAWHVIYDGANGNIPQSQIDSTIVVMNAAYAGIPGGAVTGFTFSLASVDRTNNHRWYTMEAGSTEEKQAKNSLATDVTHRLNIYSCRPPSGTNWAVFPWTYAEGNKMHGVVLDTGNLPGGDFAPMNAGDVAVHEVGHYLGLYHTFQNGCTPPGDQVDDTPDEAVPPGCCPCPIGSDTCPTPGLDPIQNYMDYTSDLCRTEFTAGQSTRMNSMVATYRPHLLNALRPMSGPMAGLAPARGFEFLGATPNPSRGTIDIGFSIPSSEVVDLRIYDLAGRSVSVLARGAFTAGSHQVRWSGTDDAGRRLASGVYFLRMQAGGEFAGTERILLAR